ncbi:MAG TPA: hypothetical protein VEU47_19015 [Candidatus Cybelea sp.]|nr:hypothetical protein [Candidatus Cybelea sp.]
MPASHIKVFYNSAIGYVTRIVISDRSDADLDAHTPAKGESFTLLPMGSGDLTAVQTLVNAATGLNPQHVKVAIVDQTGLVIGVVQTYDTTTLVKPTALSQLIQTTDPNAVPGATFSAGVFTPPVPPANVTATP